jgi:hypothetical protein
VLAYSLINGIFHGIIRCTGGKDRPPQQEEQHYEMVFLPLCTANSEAVVRACVCRHWAAAAIVAGIIQWSDIVPYSHFRANGICAMPVLKSIQCCSPDFNLMARMSHVWMVSA